MNYIEQIKSKLEKEAKVHGGLLDLYTLLVFTKGEDTTLKNVHDAWAIWKNFRMPEHRSLIPFSELSVEVQELDRSYMEAIVKVAKEMNR